MVKVLITDPDVAELQGCEILKLSMNEYIKRLHAKEEKSKIAIRCLRDRVESLENEVIHVKQSSHTAKEKAIKAVRNFWRTSILEGSSRGGKMVNVALKNKRK